MADPERLPDESDPVEILRALLRLSPEDARKAREAARQRMTERRERNDRSS